VLTLLHQNPTSVRFKYRSFLFKKSCFLHELHTETYHQQVDHYLKARSQPKNMGFESILAGLDCLHPTQKVSTKHRFQAIVFGVGRWPTFFLLLILSDTLLQKYLPGSSSILS
jgi:hypothetical protein